MFAIAATGLRVIEKHAQTRIAPHAEIDVDPSLVGLEMFGAVDAFDAETPIVVAGVESPFLPLGSKEVSFQPFDRRPAFAPIRVEARVFCISTPI